MGHPGMAKGHVEAPESLESFVGKLLGARRIGNIRTGIDEPFGRSCELLSQLLGLFNSQHIVHCHPG